MAHTSVQWLLLHSRHNASSIKRLLVHLSTIIDAACIPNHHSTKTMLLDTTYIARREKNSSPTDQVTHCVFVINLTQSKPKWTMGPGAVMGAGIKKNINGSTGGHHVQSEFPDAVTRRPLVYVGCLRRDSMPKACQLCTYAALAFLKFFTAL